MNVNLWHTELGDTCYEVLEINAAFSRTKQHREIDGETWFKYSEPNPRIEVRKLTCVSITMTETRSIHACTPLRITVEFEHNEGSAFFDDAFSPMCTENILFDTLLGAHRAMLALSGRQDKAKLT